ncbi:MAG: DUF4846 domain-containing protein [Polyangiaceae bacterium]
MKRSMTDLRMPFRSLCLAALSLAALSIGCAVAPVGSTTSAEPGATAEARPAVSPGVVLNGPKSKAKTSSSVPISAPSAVPASAAAQVDRGAYPWLADQTCSSQDVAGTLSARFSPPQGFARAPVEAGSFGAWLRGLPLRPPGPVLDHRGRVILDEGDSRFAAVAALDEGKADLQQCADSIMRLHAEWQWSKGSRAISYRAASGTPMPYSRWMAGERPSASGMSLVWKPSSRPVDREDHGAFRKYLDAVFTWANTGALARDASKVALSELRPGDFFVLAGAPGHAVLVLDVAVSKAGERAVLLGQGYMPAQSFHVLRPSPRAVWFAIDASSEGVQTPFWPAPFPWSSLRRLDP